MIGDFESKKLKLKINDLKIKYFTKQDLKLDNENKSSNKKIIKTNSYELAVEEILSLKLVTNDLPYYVLRTAGFQTNKIKEQYDYKLFQDGQIVSSEKEKIKPQTIIYSAYDKNRNVFHGLKVFLVWMEKILE